MTSALLIFWFWFFFLSSDFCVMAWPGSLQMPIFSVGLSGIYYAMHWFVIIYIFIMTTRPSDTRPVHFFEIADLETRVFSLLDNLSFILNSSIRQKDHQSDSNIPLSLSLWFQNLYQNCSQRIWEVCQIWEVCHLLTRPCFIHSIPSFRRKDI